MKWTNGMIRRAAMVQSAIDMNCRPEDFMRHDNVVTVSRPHPEARRYLSLPHICDLVTYGDNVVATASEPWLERVKAYIDRYDTAHCFETPNLHVLNDAFQQDGYRVCFMAEYFLPDVNVLKPLPCEAELRVMTQPDFADLYTDAWHNALCADRRELDVLPEYRRQGIAAALTSRLALEILDRGRVPFYCCAWSNIPSARNAAASGFRPAWAEVTVKPAAFVDQMNRT